MNTPPQTPNGKPGEAATPATDKTPAADDLPAQNETPAAASIVTKKIPRSERTDDPEAARWLIQNQSARRIAIDNQDRKEVLLLAPLEERSINKSDVDKLDIDEWEQSNVVVCKAPEEKPPIKIEQIIQAFAWIVGIFVFVGFILGEKPEMRTPLFSLGRMNVTGSGLYWVGIPTVLVVIAAFVAWRLSKKKYIIRRNFAHLLGLFLIFLIAVGLPFFGIYRFVGGHDLFSSDSPLLQLGRWLQLLFITVASLLPALLYYLFDRQQLATLQERFWRDILRLDPYVRTLSEVKAKYGKQIGEIYGSDRATGEGRLLADSRWPILVATLVITIGWFMTFLPTRSAIEFTQPSDLYDKLLTPQNTAIAFGFLGAYFYGLNLVLRRYVLGDLRPKTYTNITVRILVVFILAWVASALAPDYALAHTSVLAFSFLAGFVPETALTYFQEKYKYKNSRGPQLKETQPLTKLEGIDLYDRARLMDEGVTNIENLAHHDIVDLMLQTRIPTQRIVDWVDQSILYLHLGGDEQADACIERLRGYGVRTATCLQMAWRNKENREHLSSLFQSLDCGGRIGRQSGEDGDDAKEEADETPDVRTEVLTPHRLKIILTALKDAEWLEYIQYWRAYRLRDQQTVKDPKQIFAPEHNARDQEEFTLQLEESLEQSPNGVGEPV